MQNKSLVEVYGVHYYLNAIQPVKMRILMANTLFQVTYLLKYHINIIELQVISLRSPRDTRLSRTQVIYENKLMVFQTVIQNSLRQNHLVLKVFFMGVKTSQKNCGSDLKIGKQIRVVTPTNCINYGKKFYRY